MAGVLNGELGWDEINGLNSGFTEPSVKLFHRSIVNIDRRKQQVVDDSGYRHDYACLVLATGSRGMVPNIPGKNLEGVFADGRVGESSYFAGERYGVACEFYLDYTLGNADTRLGKQVLPWGRRTDRINPTNSLTLP